jgi:hypothetical protein
MNAVALRSVLPATKEIDLPMELRETGTPGFTV